MPTNYPAALDAFGNPNASGGDTLDDPPHDSQHADANDAIEAIETELGVNPRGSEATVRARLDAIESATSGLPLVAGDAAAVTVYDESEQTIVGSGSATVFDLTGTYDLLSGGLLGVNVGYRLTIDGTVVVEHGAPNATLGDDDAGNRTFADALPWARSTTSLKLEVLNVGGSDRDYGWRVLVRDLS